MFHWLLPQQGNSQFRWAARLQSGGPNEVQSATLLVFRGACATNVCKRDEVVHRLQATGWQLWVIEHPAKEKEGVLNRMFVQLPGGHVHHIPQTWLG